MTFTAQPGDIAQIVPTIMGDSIRILRNGVTVFHSAPMKREDADREFKRITHAAEIAA